MNNLHELRTDSVKSALSVSTSGRRSVWFVVRVVVPLVLLGYLLSRVPLGGLSAALQSVTLRTIAVVGWLMMVNLLLAAVRWRFALRACGVTSAVKLVELFRLHWIGAFYSACVPGGVGGEVVRAIATRSLFKGGFAAALGVTLLERLLGMTGLLLLVATALIVHPISGIQDPFWFGALGLLAAGACVGAVLGARRCVGYLPRSLQRLAVAIPTIVSLPSFGLGLLLSLCTQLVSCVIGHLVIADIASHVTLEQSLVIMPMVFGAAFFPFTVGGAGVRELAFVTLYGLVGVQQSDALAASFVVMGTQLLIGASGGIVQMLRPLNVDQVLLEEQRAASRRSSEVAL